MAVSGDLFNALFTQREVDARLEYIKGNLTNDITFKNQKQKLYELRKALEDKEKQMLSAFGINMTPQDLRNNIEKYSKGYGLEKLTQDSLKLVVQSYENALSKTAMTETELQEFFNTDEFQEELNKTDGNVKNAILNFVNQDIFLSEFTSKSKSGHGKAKFTIEQVKGTHSKKAGIVRTARDFSNDITEVTILDLTDIMLKRIKAFMGLNTTASRKKNTVTFTSKLPNSTNFIEWFNYTQGQKASDVTIKQKKLKQIITAFKQNLYNYITHNASDEIPKLNDIINYVFNKYPLSIFVGGNEKAITGLCGEIQALCYLSLILQDNFKLNGNIEWIAKDTDQFGHEMHADIVFNKMFGIQVKNTISKVLQPINFRSISLDKLLQNVIDMNVPDNEVLQYIFGTYSLQGFNIPYEIQDEKLVQTQTGTYYSTTWANINKLVTLADKILKTFASTFMYFGVGDALANQNGNLLYFINGDHVVFASEILDMILNQLENIESQAAQYFTIKKNTTSVNIVNYVNAKGWLRHDKKDQTKTFISRKSELQSVNIGQEILKDIVLKSSFDFSSIIKQ